MKRFGYFNDQALGEMEYGSAFDAENYLGEEPNMLFWAALYKISLSMIAILTRRFLLVGTIAHGYGDACASCVRLPLCRWALARLLCRGSASSAGSFGRFSSCPPNRRFSAFSEQHALERDGSFHKAKDGLLLNQRMHQCRLPFVSFCMLSGSIRIHFFLRGGIGAIRIQNQRS